MSFVTTSQQSTNDHSNYIHQLPQPGNVSGSNTGDGDFATNQPQGTLQANSDQLDPLERHAQTNKALNQRRSLDVNLDPVLCQQLKQDAGDQQYDNKDTAAIISDSTNTSLGVKRTKNQISKLKSAFRQVASAPASPPPSQQEQLKPINSNSSRGVKSVKFHRLHLEKVCIFQGTHSPNQVPLSDEIKTTPFKVIYSQWWPPIQQTLFQHQRNVQLKRSLKVLDNGSTLQGQVLVRNLGYEKEVEIRYTLDGWQTVHHVMAEYQHSRGALDTFVYDIPMEQQGMADRGYLRATVDLAVRYAVTINHGDNNSNGNQLPFAHRSRQRYQHGTQETFWDNNDGHNYQVQVVETPRERKSEHTTSTSIIESEVGGGPELQFPMASSSRSRYDFGQSLIKAKHKTKLSSTTDNNKDLPALDIPPSSPLETQSAPSSPPRYDLSFHSNAAPSLASSSYSDLVKNYCFYSSQDTSSHSPALSING